MARFLIATMPFVSHINPSLPIARRLVERGHEVRWYTGRKFQSRVEATGAQFVPMQRAPDFDEDDLDAAFPARKGLDGVAQFKWSIKHIFMDPAPAQVQDLQEILKDYPADVLLSETTFGGGELLSQLGGPPWAAFNILPLTIASRDTAPFGLGLPPNASTIGHLRNQSLNWLFANVLFRDVTKHFNTIRAGLGLPPTTEYGVSPFLFLQGTTPAFEYPRSDLPPQVHFIGPFVPQRPATFTPPAWWEDLQNGRKVVLVTQGTVATNSDHLIAPTLRALADEDVLVVATTGGKPVESVKVDPIPRNARIEPFLSYHHLMPHIDAMVTNGGYGSVQLALSYGIPLVGAGGTEEKPEICTRVAWRGVGINLKTKTPTEAHIRDAVRRVLYEPQYRGRAREVQADFARHDPPTEAAELLEKLAETRRPVVRVAQVDALATVAA